MKMCMGKMEDTKLTNVLKLFHGWQNGGQQKDLFYENNEENMCPAGCGECDNRLHYIQCKAPKIDKANNERQGKFHKAHKKLKTAGIIYDSFKKYLGFSEGGVVSQSFAQDSPHE